MRAPDELRSLVEGYLLSLDLSDELGDLQDSMRYALSGGGKRIRPVLCLATAEAIGCPPERALPAAAALELVHSSRSSTTICPRSTTTQSGAAVRARTSSGAKPLRFWPVTRFSARPCASLSAIRAGRRPRADHGDAGHDRRPVSRHQGLR